MDSTRLNNEAIPAMRMGNLVITQIEDETIVYDPDRSALHTLNEVVNDVWQRCDGIQSIQALSAGLDYPVEIIAQAIGELSEAGLLESSVLQIRQSRRGLMKKAGLASIPVIVSTTLIPLHAAASTCIVVVVGAAGCAVAASGGGNPTGTHCDTNCNTCQLSGSSWTCDGDLSSCTVCEFV